MSMKDMNRKATRITVDGISKVATQGVVRALEAREARGVDLTENEIDHISGGFSGGSEGSDDFATVGYNPPIVLLPGESGS